MTMSKTPQYQAYRQATQTVPATQQIVLLYDGAVRFMQQAREAMERKDIAERYNLLVKAGEIIMGLQNSLDFDTGGTIARILHDFYARIDMEILSIHQSGSLDMCDHVIRQLKQMRDAWQRVDAQQGEHHQGNVVEAALVAALPTDMGGTALSA